MVPIFEMSWPAQKWSKCSSEKEFPECIKTHLLAIVQFLKASFGLSNIFWTPWTVGDCCIMTLQSGHQLSDSHCSVLSQTTLNLSSDQIFAGDCICLLQHSILCYFERSWEHHQGWPWACVIFWLLASDLRSQAKKIVRIPSAHVGWSGHEKSIKSRVLIEILTTNDRVWVQLICYVMAPNWLPVSHWPFVRYLTQSLDQSDKSTSDIWQQVIASGF